MKISISGGIEHFQTVAATSVAELGKLACESNISTSVFQNGKRNIDSFLFADCIGLDIDNDQKVVSKTQTPTLSLDQAKRTFSQFKHIILSTRSHNVEKNGIVAERFRIILFPEFQITQANDFYATWFWLKEQFPWIDNQCKDPSRFWFKHTGILSINEDGQLITPIRYSAPEKPMKEGRPALPGERGELSKQVLNFLEFGVESGSRNGTVYKVAREFQQALFDYEEAESRIVNSLERNDVICNDFPLSEVQLAVRSAYSKEATHAPRLTETKPRAFHYQRWGDILNEPDKNEDWLIQDLLIKGGMSVVVGVPKIGKTTLVRQLEKSVLRGEPFLTKKTEKGTVVHYSFDEKARTAKRHYVQLGLNDQDNMILHFGTASHANYLKELEEDLLKIKPTLAVVDTMFDMVEVQDVNSYGPIKRALSYFSALAERTGCHIMFIHHQNKPNDKFSKKGSGYSVLGSTAILGSVDACLIFETDDNDYSARILSVQGRGVENFRRMTLSFDKEKMIYKIKGPDF
jgi:hypothetical protein